MSNQTADLIAYNGKIATQNEQRPTVEAVAVLDGKFLAVGTDREVMAWRGEQTQLINLNKRTAIPGLNDSHTHLIRGGSTTISNFAGMACRRSRTVCECCESRLGEPHLDNGSGWWAAGLSFNSPSGACRRWTS
jgi:predicted amidohydrolase YtcJ